MELSSPVRVVVVDDNPTHLVSITNGLAKAGIPCVSHWYDIQNSALVPPAPAGGYPYLRMLFTDLNIREMSGAIADPKSLAGVLISEVLQPVVAPTCGPYSICLWTSTGGKANEVSPLIIERVNDESMGEDRRPAPLLVNIMEKREFVPDKDEATDQALASLFRQNNQGPRIEESISRAILENPQLRAAFSWESRASHAAAQTINNVYEVSRFERTTDMNESRAFQTVLTKIAIEAAGKKSAKQDPPRALDDGLADLFVDKMHGSAGFPPYREAVNASIGALLAGSAPTLTTESRTALNTILHLEKMNTDGTHVERGLVLDINTDAALESLGMGNRKNFIFNELVYNSGLFESAVQSATVDAAPDLKTLEDGYKFVMAHKDELLEKTRIVAIEVGADCDHAQRKERTIRCLLGAEIPSDLALFIYGPQSKRLRSDSLREFGPWEVETGKKFHLLFSLSRFAVQQSWLRKKDFSARYRLRKPLVDQILHWYSTYSTRPGIIAIT